MAFNIILQYNSTDEDHLDKELRTIYTLTGNLRNDTDVVNPSILIECDPVYLFGDANVPGVNYFTITDFRRSYYLVNLNILETGLYELVGHVDVLSSFKDGIRAQEAIVHRQETASAYNLYINDSSLRAYQNPHVITKKFPRGFNGFSYILAVAGVKGATPVNPPGVISDLAYTYTTGTTFGYKLTFTWTADTYATSYYIYRYFPSAMNWLAAGGPVTGTTCDVDNVYGTGQGDTINFRLVAKNDYGETYSNIVTFTIP